MTVQAPRPGDLASRGDATRLGAVLALLAATPGAASAHALSERELADLLQQWLGQGTERLAAVVPAAIAVRLARATLAW